MDQELTDYIVQAQKHGLSDFEIKQNLLSAGWEAAKVEDSFAFARAVESKASYGEEKQPQPQRTNVSPVQQFQRPQFVQPEAAPKLSLNSAATLSDMNFQKSPNQLPNPSTKKPLFVIGLVAVVILVAASLGYYFLVYASPSAVWKKFTSLSSNPIYQTKFSLSYSDQQQPDNSATSTLGTQLNSIKLDLAGSGYVNGSDPSMPESSSQIQYTFGSGNTSFSTGFQYILQNKILYLNVGDNPILSMLSNAANNGKKIDWIKIDLTQLKDQASSTPSSSQFLAKLSDPDFKSQIQKIWQNSTLIKIDKYIGREKINGVTTLHYKNSLDSAALKDLVSQYVKTIQQALKGTGSDIADSDAQTINEITSQIVDKIVIKEFETWVGVSDFKLYRVHLLTNAPSLISLIKNSQTFSLPKSSDAQRLSDVRQLAIGLELYFNAHNGYPDGSNGVPADMTPNFISAMPTAPPANGNCSEYFNTYWYQPSGKKHIVQGKTVYDSYTLTFCLGADSSGYKAGVNKLSPSGIMSVSPCPGTVEQCSASNNPDTQNQAMAQQIQSFISKLDFNAVLKADVDYTNYGKKQPVNPPQNSFDILQKYSATQGLSSDAKRLSDVRVMATALELYFNDKNSYPDALNHLIPTYIHAVPTAPDVATDSSVCSSQDNAYTYKQISKNKFQLSFCLSQTAGGYSAGKHTLTESGIQ